MSKRPSLKDFQSAVRQIVRYRPEKAPTKPEKAPSTAQLKQRWKLVRRQAGKTKIGGIKYIIP